MRGIACITLVILMILTILGCSQPASKTEEELKAEVRAEMEEEAKLKEELRAELEKVKQEDSDEKLIYKGTVLDARSYGVGIKLDKEITLNGNTTSELYFDMNQDSIDLLDYVPRKYFIYTEEYPMVKSNLEIAVAVEVDADSYGYTGDGLAKHYYKATKIISMDGVENPPAVSGEDYSIEYYTDAFFNLLGYVLYMEGYDGLYPNDIKDFFLYKYTGDSRGDEFRKVVDQLLESGLHIQQSEGSYMVNKEKVEYSE